MFITSMAVWLDPKLGPDCPLLSEKFKMNEEVDSFLSETESKQFAPDLKSKFHYS